MMAKAFQCDLCRTLESGDPAQTINIGLQNGGSRLHQLCTSCLVSLDDWLESRRPNEDQPTTSVDVPFQGA